MKYKEIEYDLQSIVVTNFSINLKKEYIDVLKENPIFNAFTIEINSSMKAYNEADTVIVEIGVLVFLDPEKNVELGNIIVHNSFKIIDIKRFISKEILNLPKELNTTLITMSISHTRAILTTKCAGTFLSNVLIPIVNIDQFVPKS